MPFSLEACTYEKVLNNSAGTAASSIREGASRAKADGASQPRRIDPEMELFHQLLSVAVAAD
jgi:hypothetical protein